MRRNFVLVLGVCLGLAIPAWAQDDYPRVELYGGYNFMRADTSEEAAELLGVDQHRNSNGFLLGVVANPHRNIGIEGEFSAHWFDIGIPLDSEAVSIDGIDIDAVDIGLRHLFFLAGPRVAGRYERLTPWGHALFGFVNTEASALGVSESETNFAMGLGAGVDVNASDHLAIRVIQVDYMFIDFDVGEVDGLVVDVSESLHNVRLAFGIVIKF